MIIKYQLNIWQIFFYFGIILGMYNDDVKVGSISFKIVCYTIVDYGLLFLQM